MKESNLANISKNYNLNLLLKYNGLKIPKNERFLGAKTIMREKQILSACVAMHKNYRYALTYVIRQSSVPYFYLTEEETGLRNLNADRFRLFQGRSARIMYNRLFDLIQRGNDLQKYF